MRRIFITCYVKESIYIYVSFSLSRCFNMNDEMKRSTDFFIIIFSMAVENR